MNNKEYNTLIISASKSYLQRALAVSTLAEGTSILTNISWCNDSIAAKNIIKQLGAELTETNRNIKIKSNGLNLKTINFTADEAGLSIRMFSPVLALFDKEITFTGTGSLLNRPVNIIAEALSQLGVSVKTNNGFLPIKIRGSIKPQKIIIDGSLSSQLLTGLLIALPLANGNTQIIVENLNSIPYIDMTLEIIKEFGVHIEHNNYKSFFIEGNQKYKAIKYNVEGDWSSGAFFLVLGAVKGKIKVDNLNYKSAQADKEIIKVLQKAGAKITINKNSIIAEKNNLKAFNFDATNCPDLFPPIVCLASQCKGESVIKGVSRLTHKESNRAEVLKTEFSKIGINISIKNNLMYITGGKIKQGNINSNNDHRIAMAGAIMNEFCEKEITVKNKKAVNKSYPTFFDELKNL